MSVVIDASVAIKWVLIENGSDAADLLLDEELIAPVLWIAEAANVLWRRARLGHITADEAQQRLTELLRSPVSPIAVDPHIGSALELATRFRHPIFDCLYLAVALAHDTHVVTADRRFAAAAALPPLAGRVRFLGAA